MCHELVLERFAVSLLFCFYFVRRVVMNHNRVQCRLDPCTFFALSEIQFFFGIEVLYTDNPTRPKNLLPGGKTCCSILSRYPCFSTMSRKSANSRGAGMTIELEFGPKCFSKQRYTGEGLPITFAGTAPTLNENYSSVSGIKR